MVRPRDGDDPDENLGNSSEWSLVGDIPEELRRLGQAPPRGKRVLIVHEDAAFRKLALRAAQLGLASIPTRIKLLASGTQLLADMVQKVPDLLFLDWKMSPMSGEDTLTRLRATPQGSRVRVLLVSGRLTSDERAKAEALGVRDMVARPVDFPALVRTVVAMAIREGWLPPGTEPSLTR